MSRYTGLLFTADEYWPIGPFRFPIYKDLVPGEARGIEDLARKQSKSTYASLKLAQRIAADKDIPVKDAVELMSNASTEDNQELLFSYAEELEALTTAGVSTTEQVAAFSTLCIRYRGEVKLPKEKNWTKTDDWTDEDTNQIPTKMLNDIYQFMLWERDGWPEDSEEEKE
jgi:hypothetical protein